MKPWKVLGTYSLNFKNNHMIFFPDDHHAQCKGGPLCIGPTPRHLLLFLSVMRSWTLIMNRLMTDYPADKVDIKKWRILEVWTLMEISVISKFWKSCIFVRSERIPYKFKIWTDLRLYYTRDTSFVGFWSTGVMIFEFKKVDYFRYLH